MPSRAFFRLGLWLLWLAAIEPVPQGEEGSFFDSELPPPYSPTDAQS